MNQQYTDNNLMDKLKKLLTLAGDNPAESDNEAIQALALAQKLMAKHGITQSDIDSMNAKAPKITRMACVHKWDAGYRQPLASVIAENYRCKALLVGKTVCFMGRENDALIAKNAFEFAYKFIMRRGNQEYEKVRNKGFSGKGVFNSYAIGFIAGLKEVLDKQCKSLMIVTPPEVIEEYNNLSVAKASGGVRQKDGVYKNIYDAGKQDAIDQYSTKTLK